MPSERIQRQIDRLLDEAEEGISQLDWEIVRARAEAVLTLVPDNPDASFYLEAARRALASDAPQQPEGLAAQPTSFADGRYVVERFLKALKGQPDGHG